MKSSRLLFAAFALAIMSGLGYVAQQAPSSGPQMVVAAQEFLGSLDAEQKKRASYAYDHPERFKWFFIPLQGKDKKSTRKGVPLEDMTPKQKTAALNLLKAGCSDRGAVAATTIMSLEAILREQEKKGAMVRNPEWYFFTIFGTPGKTEKWGWRVEGHHLSLNFSLEGAQVASATPSFFGANPAEVKMGAKKGLRILAPSEDLAAKLFASLTPEQQKVAHQAKPFGEPAQGTKTPNPGAPVGIAASEFKENQVALLMDLLKSYTDRMPPDVAAEEWKGVKEGGVGKIHFAYTGDPTRGKGHTYRVQGPTFVIEFLNIQADSAGNPANHIHSAWRRMKGDFGL